MDNNNQTYEFFNHDGHRVYINNIDTFFVKEEFETIENLYKWSIYYHALNLELNYLQTINLLILEDGEPYDPTIVTKTITHFEEYIVEQKGIDHLHSLIESVDFSFLDNKPNSLKN